MIINEISYLPKKDFVQYDSNKKYNGFQDNVFGAEVIAKRLTVLTVFIPGLTVFTPGLTVFIPGLTVLIPWLCSSLG